MHPGQGQSHSAAMESDVQPVITDELLELRGILEQAWPLMRSSGLVCEVTPPAAGGDAGGGDGEGGQGGDGLGLYSDLLTDMPDHVRQLVEPVLKQMEGKVTQRFQEHADFRKQWEPYQEVEGLTDLQAEELSELVAFRREILGDPEAFKGWWTELGESAGWMPDGSGGDGDDDEDLGGDVPPEVTALQGQVEELTNAVQQLVQGHQTQEQTQAKQAAVEAINAELETLATEHLGEGQKFDDETREAILTFALRYADDPEAIAKGFKDLQKIKGGAQSELVDDKLEQPGGATRGGRPDTAPAEITDFKQAKELARSRRAAAVGT